MNSSEMNSVSILSIAIVIAIHSKKGFNFSGLTKFQDFLSVVSFCKIFQVKLEPWKRIAIVQTIAIVQLTVIVNRS